ARTSPLCKDRGPLRGGLGRRFVRFCWPLRFAILPAPPHRPTLRATGAPRLFSGSPGREESISFCRLRTPHRHVRHGRRDAAGWPPASAALCHCGLLPPLAAAPATSPP